MRKSLLIPNAMICVLWKAVCSETGLYSLGRGQRRRAGKYLAGALLHVDAGKERKLLPMHTRAKAPLPIRTKGLKPQYLAGRLLHCNLVTHL